MIDNDVIAIYVTREPQEMRPLEWNLPVEVIWRIPINLGTRVDHSSAPAALRSIVRRGGFDLSALAAGEFHPRGQSSATETGICIGNCLRCLPGQFEILSGFARWCTGQANPPVPGDSGIGLISAVQATRWLHLPAEPSNP